MIKVYNLAKLRDLRPPSMWRASPAHMVGHSYWSIIVLEPQKAYFQLGYLYKEIDYEKI